MVSSQPSSDFWGGKRVLVTGHTGFKGSWLALWLLRMGADVAGLALAPEQKSLFGDLNLSSQIDHAVCDIRDLASVTRRIEQVQPDIVIHLAAQSLVLTGYRDPVETWATNVMGTVHVMEALRKSSRTKVFLAATTDKVYAVSDGTAAFREDDALGGIDPYSASKAACELAIASSRASFLDGAGIGVASARAGNVIGGGDWSENRLIPDLARALQRKETLRVRHPAAIRPWQHVLEPLRGYLKLCEALWTGRTDAAAAFNFGPGPSGDRSVAEVISTALDYWPGAWEAQPDQDAPTESARLVLNADKAREVLGWTPKWNFQTSIQKTMEWYRSVNEGTDPLTATERDIEAYEAPHGV